MEKKVEELKEKNNLLRKDIEWLNRESNTKDKLLSEKVSMLNNLIQKVNTTTTPTESNYQPATRSLSNENFHHETDNRQIIHLIGSSIIIIYIYKERSCSFIFSNIWLPPIHIASSVHV